MSQSLIQKSDTPLIKQLVANSPKSYEFTMVGSGFNQITLLPLLTSTVIDELLRSFGFSPNSRPHLIKQGLFPKGVPLRSRAMSTSLYPALSVDLIALLAANNSENSSKSSKSNQELAARLKEEINELTQLDLFVEVLASLARRLPVGQPFTLAAITRLFRPILPTTLKLGDFPSFEQFGTIDYSTWEKWYQLAQLQHQFRNIFFELSSQVEGGLFSEGSSNNSSSSWAKLRPVASIILGVVEGSDHSGSHTTSAVLRYSSEEGELAFQEEVELPNQLLSRLGCDWVDAPIARVEATRDAYFSRLIFYLPGLHNPASLQKLAKTLEFLGKSSTSPFGTIEGFERPWDENTLDEIMAEVELEQEKGQASN